MGDSMLSESDDVHEPHSNHFNDANAANTLQSGGFRQVSSSLSHANELGEAELVDEVYVFLVQEQCRLSFSVQNILLRFVSAFRDTFSISKKCHFDSLPEHWADDDKVVDGARMKWCFPLFLDAMSSFLDKDEFNLSHRRTFNQHKVLYECIHAELQEMHPSLYALLVSKKTAPRKSDTSPRDCFPRLARVPREQLGHCEFIDTHTLPEPWQDMQRLQSFILSGPTTKSREKLVHIVGWLCEHPALRDFSFDVLAAMRAVIHKALFTYIQHTIKGEDCWRSAAADAAQGHATRRSARSRKRTRSVSSMHLLPLGHVEKVFVATVLTAEEMLTPAPSPSLLSSPPSFSSLSPSPPAFPPRGRYALRRATRQPQHSQQPQQQYAPAFFRPIPHAEALLPSFLEDAGSSRSSHSPEAQYSDEAEAFRTPRKKSRAGQGRRRVG
eukprot:gene37227-45187_t